ncbi:hypothetical protein BC936DRAFT_137953 [Jimgerdemannia flammicorona]|uniref:Uncharacterized protein n=2 Tax=Jimgerdemannia flammicorona TaxID=994334 RepID=A0A433Q4U8_9FUNG|nr:hypothetical protein BC936DRAFT_137953 [Jimgerdemannia flammicorona]RUS24694.1 hypothetical protein BC938DRAFT_473221 [Jimgerdemannia flammicorona]
MASRLFWRPRLLANAAPSTRQLVARRTYSDHHHKEEVKFPAETFSAPIWRNTAVAVLLGIVWYRVDQHLTSVGEEKHPVTKWLEYHMTPEKEWRRINEKHMDSVAVFAEDKLLFQDVKIPQIHRLRYPECSLTASHLSALRRRQGLRELQPTRHLCGHSSRPLGPEAQIQIEITIKSGLCINRGMRRPYWLGSGQRGTVLPQS